MKNTFCMKKIFLSLIILGCSVPMIAQDESSQLDFVANGITYTILNENEKTCQTKAGKSEIIYENTSTGHGVLTTTYGNSISGPVTIPATVEKTGDDSSQSPVTYKVVGVGSYSFQNATSITVSQGVTTINAYAFTGNPNLASVDIQDPSATLGEAAFSGCSALTQVNLPANLIAIPAYCFSACTSLKDITIPDNVSYIGDMAFLRCTSLQSVTMPNSVLQIGESSFQNCSSISQLTLSSALTAIPFSAFSGCNQLTELDIPASVKSIADYAFNCDGLTQINCYSLTPPAISYSSFDQINYSGATLYVYKSAYPSFQKSTLWKNFTDMQMLPIVPESISVTPSTLNLNTGISGQLSAVLSPSEAVGDITWSIESAVPADCITLDNSKVTARKTGTATVTAKCGELTASCNVIINANPQSMVRINPLSGDIFVGNEVTLSATVTPSTITPSLTWTSSNTSVATIDNTGKLTALAPGATIITATNEGVSGKLAVTVYEIAPESIELNQSAVTLKAGGTVTLTATVSPSNTTYPTVSWESSNPAVAVVADGVVTALGVGTANIKAACGGYTANCTVTVEETPAESVTISSSQETLKVGQSLQLSASVAPETTTDKTVEWSSDNSSVASVSTEGEVTAIAVGTATITATCGTVSATCNVTVEAIASEELILNYTALTLKVNNTQQLTATIYPLNTTDQTVTWTSSNESVASVVNGLITALMPGEASITATNGTLSATCSVIVEEIPAQQVILPESSISVNVGGVYALTATVLPADVTNATIIWESLNEEIAVVSGGLVQGVAPGTAIITATCGNAYASCTVAVMQPATSITLNETSLELGVGEIYDLIETVEPANTTDVVTWSSSDTDVAIVDENGIITALTSGTAIITATCGTQTAICVVKVSEISAEEIELNETELTLMKGDTYQLIATVLPDDTTNPTVTWSTSNSSVATVAQDGTVTANSAGSATISAICGNVFATCIVTVLPETSSIESLLQDPAFEGTLDIYDISGKHIIKTGDVNVVKSLQPGIYIINKRKILL